MHAKRVLLLGTISLLCTMMAGCWEMRSYEVIAKYDLYSFGRRSSEKSFYAFALDLEGTGRKPPSIEIMLPDGKIFNCGSITSKSADSIFPHRVEFKVASFDHQLDKTIQLHKVGYDADKEYTVSVVFCEGKLESVIVRGNGKFLFPDQKEFVSLPLSESDMKKLFGQPDKYVRTYSSNP